MLFPVYSGGYSATFQQYQENVLVPPAPTRHRVLVQEEDCWDRPDLFVRGIRNASGYAGYSPLPAWDYGVNAAAKAHEVEWVYAGQWVRFADGWRREGRWRQLAKSVPYVRLVPKCVRSGQPREDVKHIDVHDTVLVEEDLRLPPGPAGTAELLSGFPPPNDSPGRLLVKTSAGLERMLAVAESFHPGWQARIDGAPVEKLRLYGDLLGCLVPAGEHRVEFVYHSAALEFGAKLSLAGVLASLAVFSLAWFAARRGRRVACLHGVAG